MRDLALQKELDSLKRAARNRERDPLVVSAQILDELDQDLSHSIVDNSENLAQLDEVLGWTPDRAVSNGLPNGNGSR